MLIPMTRAGMLVNRVDGNQDVFFILATALHETS